MTHYLFPIILLAMTPVALAAEAHVHGQAHLEVAVDGGTLTLRLESPADSLVGFEHSPRTDKERQAVAAMKQRLDAPDKLFQPTPAAQCQVTGVKLESTLFEAGQEDAVHGDLDAEFVFHCAQPARLQNIEVKLFAPFPGIKQLSAELAGPKGQKTMQLTPAQRNLSW